MLVRSWYCSCMKQTLYRQTMVSISDSLPAAAVDIHKFSANTLHSAGVSKITYTYYNLENLRTKEFFVKQCCPIISRALVFKCNHKLFSQVTQIASYNRSSNRASLMTTAHLHCSYKTLLSAQDARICAVICWTVLYENRLITLYNLSHV